MATNKDPTPLSRHTPTAEPQLRTTARSTIGGPNIQRSHLTPNGDILVNKLTALGALAAAMPVNVNKAQEYGRASREPPLGQTVEPISPTATGSTVTETTVSGKTGRGEPLLGVNLLNLPLDRVRADASRQVLTTNQGVPLGDNQSSLKAGLRGPALLEDFILREKITHFDHERIPERIVHARGSGAHGIFECYRSLSQVTRASIFDEDGKRTPVFVRFSTVLGERGSADTARDVRGFAVKFYTDDGNWDLVGNNMPVFFIQDAMKFPDLIHAAKPEPDFGMPQASTAHDTFWDFVSLMPESTHMLLWVMSDRAIPRSYRMMQGFGVHTFRFVNAGGESHFVKFHWQPIAGTHSLDWDEAQKLAGADPDYHRRDLWESIETGVFPEYELGVQIFTEEQAEGWSFDVLDATKLVPEELVPVQPIGRLTLNRNPDSFFAETEQVAFCASHIVPGIDFSNDPLLAGRLHSYQDTQLSRLGGPNFHEIPINAPLAQVHNNQRDGLHRQTLHRGKIAYEPNSLGGGCPFQAGLSGFASFPERIADDKVRGKAERFADHYTQATLFWNSQTSVEKAHILRAFRFELTRLRVPEVRQRVVAMLANVATELAEPLAAALGMTMPEPMPTVLKRLPRPEVEISPALSLFARPGSGSIAGQRIAILMADGVDGEGAQAIQAGLLALDAVPRLLGVRLGSIHCKNGLALQIEATFETTPAVLYDALVVPDGLAAALGKLPLALEFIKDQYRHGKPILVLGAGSLESAGVPLVLPNGEVDTGLILRPDGDADQALPRFVAALVKHRHYAREHDLRIL